MGRIKLFKNEDKARLIEFNELVHKGNIKYHIEHLMFINPFNSIENFAYIEIDGNIAAMVGFLQYRQQFGYKEVDVGEVTYVGTHPDYRKLGLCTELMNYWLDYAKENKISLCLLYGIANFYEQFGFEYALPSHFYSYVNIRKDLISEITGSYKTERLHDSKEEYIKEIKTIYDKSSKQNFCSRARSLEYFQYRIKDTNKTNHSWYVALNDEIVKGYIWLSLISGRIIVREAEIVDDVAGKSLCELIYNLTKENEEIKTIEMWLPLNNKFSQFVYKKGASFSCTSEIYPSNWAGMYKIVDLMATMEILVPSFEKRLHESRFYDYSINFNIAAETMNAGFNIQNGKVIITNYIEASMEIDIPMNILTSIFTGYKGISYYEERLNFKNKEIHDIFKVLFPYCNPYYFDLEMSDELE